jgi:hypothetical protein
LQELAGINCIPLCVNTIALCSLRHVVIDQLVPGWQIDGDDVIVKFEIAMVVGRNVVGRLQLFTFTEILGSLSPVHKKRNYIINDVKSKFFLLKKVNSFSWSWKCFK